MGDMTTVGFGVTPTYTAPVDAAPPADTTTAAPDQAMQDCNLPTDPTPAITSDDNQAQAPAGGVAVVDVNDVNLPAGFDDATNAANTVVDDDATAATAIVGNNNTVVNNVTDVTNVNVTNVTNNVTNVTNVTNITNVNVTVEASHHEHHGHHHDAPVDCPPDQPVDTTPVQTTPTPDPVVDCPVDTTPVTTTSVDTTPTTTDTGSGDPVTTTSTDGPTTVTPTQTQAPLEHRFFSSTGDPHEVSGDGTHFDNQLQGDITLAKSQSGDFMLQAHQGQIPGTNVTANQQVAVKAGNDVVKYDATTHKLSVNGQDVDLATLGGGMSLPGGGSIQRQDADHFTITTPKGDEVSIHDLGNGYMDINGAVSAQRKPGEVAGALGTFDGTGISGQELIGRDGKQYGTDADGIKAFEESWRTTDNENMLNGNVQGTASAAGTAANQSRFWSSTGDPHEVSGDGTHFENQQRGDFTKLRSTSGDFEVQTRQGGDPASPVTVNLAAAVKCGNDIVTFDAQSHQLRVNGQLVDLEATGGGLELPGGGQVQRQDADHFIVTSAMGDEVMIHDLGNSACDVTGMISPLRGAGEVRGSIGTFNENGQVGQDLVGRDGQTYGTDPASVAAFENTWRSAPNESLLPPPSDATRQLIAH